MGLSKIQFNLLGLLKFNKDTVVFSETELVETINHLQSSLNFELLLDKQNNSFSEHILYNIFEIDRQIIEEEFRERYWQDNPGKQVIYEFSLDKCLIGYYHHRIIFYCDLRVANSEHN